MSKAILITGGTRGIGHATAEALLRAGHRVAFTGTSDDGVVKAEMSLARSISTHAPTPALVGIRCDVRDPGEVALAVQTTVSRFGRIDVLVNCAGVGVGARVSDLPHDEWNRIIGINLTGVFTCCKAVIPHMRTSGGGWIINVSSLSSTGPFPGGAAYVASKAGVNAFSDALMQELRGDRIRVTTILPGSVATGFSGREPATGAEWKLHPEDVAEAIVDLLAYPARALPSRIEIRPAMPPDQKRR